MSWDRVGERLREMAAKRSARRFRVTQLAPLVLEALDSDERLEQGDEDVEIDDRFLGDAAVGDTAAVIEDKSGDFIVLGLIADEDNPRPVRSHTQPISTVTGLQAEINAIKARLDALEGP